MKKDRMQLKALGRVGQGGETQQRQRLEKTKCFT